MGIDAVWGFGPSRGSPFSLHIPPHPPPWPSFKVLWRGKGGQGRLCTPHVAGRSAGQPSLAQTQKTMIVMMGKGAMVFKTMRPVYSLVTYACTSACRQQSKERQSLEGEAEKRVDKTQTTKGARGKGKEVFGVWMQAGHTHIQHFSSNSLNISSKNFT